MMMMMMMMVVVVMMVVCPQLPLLVTASVDKITVVHDPKVDNDMVMTGW